MLSLINTVLSHLKGHKAVYVLLVTLGVILVTDTPIRDSVLHMVNIGTHTRQLKTAAAIEEIQVELNSSKTRQEGVIKILDEIKVFQLMTTITNDNLPIALRLQAYDEYTRAGYNSWVHEYYENSVAPLSKNIMRYRLEELKK